MNIAMLLDLPAMLAGDHVALIEGDTRQTYGQAHGRAGAVARVLADAGVGTGDVVGYLGANHVEFVSALFGCASLGACLAALNYRSGAADVRHLVADSGAKLLLVDEAAAPAVIEAGRELGVRMIGLADLSTSADVPLSVPDDTEDTDVAVLIYTSGTTARAKGVPLTHGALTEYVLSRTDVTDGSDVGRTLISVPLYHIAGISSLLTALYGGRTVVLEPRFAPAEWLAQAAEHRITHAFLVPTMLAKLIDAPELAGADLTALTSVSYGAAPMPPTLLRRIVAALPPSVGYNGAYGLSESVSTVAVLDEDDHRRFIAAESPEDAALINSVGRAVSDVRIDVLDDAGEPVEPNRNGRIAIVSRRNVSGYWHDGNTQPVAAESRLVTGDLGYLDTRGYLFITGRASDMIIRGGENISPVEVENALLEDDRVADAAVLGVPDETWGEVVGAFVVLRAPGGTFTLDDAARACAGLARFKRPERIYVVADLPRTSTGKLLRRELPV
ncbi:MAG TPA: AMP-binding protein [Pseudonocardiaceae bacterium]|nr:AMP-binding protein [Pseudonocardiaceae bacterium]